MTDKELRKLSRLELLEMLLDVSKENENLKQIIEKYEAEDKVSRNIAYLAEATDKLNSAIEQINKFSDKNQNSPDSPRQTQASPARENTGNQKSKHPDGELYCHIITAFARDESTMSLLPEQLQNKIKNRIKEIRAGN